MTRNLLWSLVCLCLCVCCLFAGRYILPNTPSAPVEHSAPFPVPPPANAPPETPKEPEPTPRPTPKSEAPESASTQEAQQAVQPADGLRLSPKSEPSEGARPKTAATPSPAASPQAARGLRLTGKSAAPDAERVSNPKPAAGDILLPMPGGLRMALRPVCVPAGGYLDDARLPFGVAAAAEGDASTSEAWADRRYSASLTAPFELSDLPAGWVEPLRGWLAEGPAGTGEGLRAFLYFIGKYEVSRGQWRAVMEGDDNFKLQPGDDRPMTDVSWFDALEFTRRYSEWLMRHHPDTLPFFRMERRSSFIRLPTEAEWEYAARGGHRVSPVERERTRLHPAPDHADMGEYIIASQFDATLNGPAAIGSRKGNPLNLHDMLGNGAEMVQTPFHLVAAGQLVGNQGGFVIKGGSWRAADLANLHPGRRIEADYFVDGAAQKRDDLGFRVSLGSILSPRDRHTSLKDEWEKRTAPRSAMAATLPQQDVRVLIREVVREVESPALKQRLAEAEEVASLYHAQVNAGEDRMMHELLLGAAFSLETIANYAARCYQLIRLMDAYAALAPAERKGEEAKEDKMRQDIRGFVAGMQGVLHYYREMLRTMSEMDSARLEKQFASVSMQFDHPDSFSRNLTKRLKVLQGHVDDKTPGNPPHARDDLEILRDILPDWLMPSLKKYWTIR